MITFYGHFSGWSSYPIVCQNIVKYLSAQKFDFQVCDFRAGEGYTNLVAHKCRLFNFVTVPEEQRVRVLRARQMSDIGSFSHLASIAGTAPGIGLVFGFPEWIHCVPRHEIMLGYHVCDYPEIPPHWVTTINEHCDRVLTPSKWCRNAFRNAGIDTPITIVQHGFDPDVFSLKEAWTNTSRSILHLCSALEPRRKGTHILLSAFEHPRFQDWTLTIRTQSQKVKNWVRAHPRRAQIYIDDSDPLTPREMAAYYRKFHKVVCPSLAEGFGMIPLEAAACGVPVVYFGETGEREYAAAGVGSLATPKTLGDKILAEQEPARPEQLAPWHWRNVLQPLGDLLRSLL